MSADSVLVLRATGGRSATKRFVWRPSLNDWGKVGYSAGALFRPEVVPVSGLRDLAAKLEIVSRDPTAFLVRGDLSPWAAERLQRDPGALIRRQKLVKENRPPPSLIESDHSWIMIDVDGWPLRQSDDLVDDPAAAIDAAICELLPDAFANAECWWQLSSSAGFVPGLLKCHLFFWLSEPASNRHINDVLKQHAPGVDRCTFSSVQPHYVASPIVEGRPDPIPRRSGWRKGENNEVTLPELRPEEPRQWSPRTPGTAGGDIDDAVAALGDGDGLNGFHEPLRLACLRYARQCQRSGERDDEALRDRLREAIHAAPRRPGRSVDDYLTTAYLARSVDGAFALLNAKPAGGHRQPASAANREKPRRALAGQIDLARRGVVSTLPAYYPAPTEGRASALERQVRVIRETIAESACRAAARREIWRRRNQEIDAMGLPGLELQPPRKAAITRRHHRAVAAETGFGKRIPLAPRVLTTGAQAVGKTAAAIGAIAAIRDPLDVWFTSPTVEKAAEVFRDYRTATANQPGALPGMVVRGRNQPDPKREGHRMCDRAEIAHRVAAAGLSVRKMLCPSCPFLASCGTRRQAREIGDRTAGVYFLASAYLFLPSPAPTPDILVVDEQVTVVAVDVAEVLLSALDPFMIRGLGVDTQATMNTLRLVLSTGGPALLELRKANIDKAELAAVLRSLDAILQHSEPDIAGDMDDATIGAKLDGSPRLAVLDARKIVAAVRREIDMPRDGLNGVSADRTTVTVSRLRAPRGIKHAGVLAMDGTGDESLNRQLFGATLQHERIAVERDAFITGTIGKGYARQSLTGIDANGKPIAAKAESSAKLRAEIGSIARAMPGSCAIFSNQSVVDVLVEDQAIGKNAPAGHFNKLRGLNGWEQCRSALVVGQNSLRIEDLEGLARAYMVTDPTPFISMAGPLAPEDAAWEAKQWPFLATRMRRMRDGTTSPVVVPVHPDPRCQRMLEQVRESEVIQAADRVRPIFNRRDLALANNLCVDATYDRIRTHSELAAGGTSLERVLALTGVLPLNAEDLYRAHPSHFVSLSAAERALQNYPPSSKGNSICEGGVVFYRTEGQRGPASKAVIDLVWHADPLTALRRYLGDITEFQGEKLAPSSPLPGAIAARLVGGMPADDRWPESRPFARPLTHAPPHD